MIIFFFYVIYIILVFLLFSFLKKSISDHKTGLLEFCFILSIIFPIAGLIVSLFLLLLSIKRTKKASLQQYSDDFAFHVDNYEEILSAAKQDKDLISFSSGLEIDKPDLHKQLIVQLSLSSISNEGTLLRKAIHHKDAETVHYAATTLHVLNERYEKQIDDLNKKFAQMQQQEIADELASCYLKYMESDLLSDQQMQRIITEFMTLLSKVMELFPNEAIYPFHHGNLLTYEKRYTEAEKQFQQLIRLYPDQFYGYVGLLEIYYEQKLWTEFYDLLSNITSLEIRKNLPRKYKMFIQQISDIHIEDERDNNSLTF